MMTPAQLATLKAYFDADPTLSAYPNNSDGPFAVAEALNVQAAPAFTVWRTSDDTQQIMANGFVWSAVDTLAAGKARIWEWMSAQGTIDPSNDKICVERLSALVESKFTRISYTDAIEELRKSGETFEFPVSWGMDLQSEHERFLTEKVVKGPVAVVNYPKDIKAFYTRLNDDEKTVAAMDVLAPGIGEIIGGSQREERLDVLDRWITEMGLDPKDYWWYRDLRRYGTVPHAGFGLGFERAIQYATGIENIRDVIPFPRAPKRSEF